MSIFGNILSIIFSHAGHSGPNNPPAQFAQAAPNPELSGLAQTGEGIVPSATDITAASASYPTAGAQSTVDVTSVLDGLAATKEQSLDWRRSIVDMMKLLDLDSSLTARKELAAELHYAGDPSDSAPMNNWLHKQVMQKLADNGGKVPDELRG